MNRIIGSGPVLPQEPESGAVVLLVVKYGSPSHYTYIAFRAPTGNWFVTGWPGEYVWAALWQRLGGAELLSAVEMGRGRVLAW